MSLLTLSTCNLFTKNKRHSNVVVHCLDKLLENDVYIPKKPHRHTFYQLLFVEEGNGIHKIDFNDYKITNNSLFFLAPGQVHNLILSSQSKGVLINFSEDLFHTFLANPQIIDEYPFFYRNGKYSFYQLKEDDNIVFDVLDRIRITKDKKLRTLYLLELFILINKNYKEILKNSYSSGQKMIIDFDSLIEKNYNLEHYPKFYADKLSVTPNYLNSVCQKVRSKKAGDIIRDRIMLETKRLLVNSKLTVTEIAYSLGFNDNSYFTKFFKQHEKITPTQFRNNL